MPTISKNRLLCLFGPTASGKTEALSGAFQRIPTFEIISADSVQVYTGLDVGSAKPSREELSRIPHHLIDILTPAQQFSAGEFVQRAEQAVLDISGRGKLPVISGGTAFYFANYLYGLPTAPPSSPEVRDRVEVFVREQGETVLHRLLSEVDPESHSRLALRDLYRRKRALEVFWDSGKPLSAFAVPREVRPELDALLVAVDRPREEIYRRVNQRVDQMFNAGFVDEVESLLAVGWDPSCPGLKSIGYYQLVQWISDGKRANLEAIKDSIRQETRRYAKRQLTFFRSLPGVQWINPDNLQGVMEDWMTKETLS